jgi:flagellar motor switch protein FliN
MTEATLLAPEAAPFVAVWAESLAQVLGQISRSPFPCTPLGEAPGEMQPIAETDLWIACACSGGLRGELSLRLPAASATRLARLLMGEAAPEGANATPAPAETGVAAESAGNAEKLSAEHGEAATELFRQVAGLVSSSLKAQWGEVQLRPEAAAGAPSWPSSSTAWIRAGENVGSAAWIEVHLSAALGAALRAEKNAAAPASPEAPAAAPKTSPPTPGSDSQVKLDMLLDVALALTLRFGSRSLPLGEVLDLHPGAVIELDRQVQDPVDVLLDGRLVARGEVVVMEGNYGLRVTEIGPGSSA